MKMLRIKIIGMKIPSKLEIQNSNILITAILKVNILRIEILKTKILRMKVR